MIASAANLAPVLEMPGSATRKRHERMEIEFLTCRISYNKCDTENSTKRASRISHLQTHFHGDFCDTSLDPSGSVQSRGEATTVPLCLTPGMVWPGQKKSHGAGVLHFCCDLGCVYIDRTGLRRARHKMRRAGAPSGTWSRILRGAVWNPWKLRKLVTELRAGLWWCRLQRCDAEVQAEARRAADAGVEDVDQLVMGRHSEHAAMCSLSLVLTSQALSHRLVISFSSLLPESFKLWYAAHALPSSLFSRCCSAQLILVSSLSDCSTRAAGPTVMQRSGCNITGHSTSPLFHDSKNPELKVITEAVLLPEAAIGFTVVPSSIGTRS
jgi:hypothetical protein